MTTTPLVAGALFAPVDRAVDDRLWGHLSVAERRQRVVLR